ncbi:hypothetical protein Tco_0348815 [Tanacetum coccineum]
MLAEEIGKLGAKGDIGFLHWFIAAIPLSAMALKAKQFKALLQSMTSVNKSVQDFDLHGKLKEDLRVVNLTVSIDADHTKPCLHVTRRHYMGLNKHQVGLSGASSDDADILVYSDVADGVEKSRDADYAGCKDTFKSTSGEAQFLGEKLGTRGNGYIELYFVKEDLEYQLAALFTKALPVDRFNYLVRRLGELFGNSETLNVSPQRFSSDTLIDFSIK